MISLDQILNFYPPALRDHPVHRKYLVKEYLQLMILDFLATTPYIRKLSFIGGTNLRLVKGIDRFSEDLDFDCKNLEETEFMEMTDLVLQYLRRLGINTEPLDKENKRLKAFRRNLAFPGLLQDMKLTGHRNERFLIKLECQDQGVEYHTAITNIKGCGYFFPFPVAPDPVLCSMKIAALLSRQKGRDFYDVMFLLSQSAPDWSFLITKCGIHDPAGLKSALDEILQKVNLSHKSRDFEHLLFERRNSSRILQFKDFVDSLELRA
jgi:predicted nucleotidyltransferase component of viral defense system